MSNVKNTKSAKSSKSDEMKAQKAQATAARLAAKAQALLAKQAGAAGASVKSAPVATTTSVDGAFDALKGRVDSRTHAMHVVLMRAYSKGALLRTSEIVAQARELLGAEHKSYEKLDRTAPSHLDTMRKRNFIERHNGAWRLTSEGATLANVSAPKNAK